MVVEAGAAGTATAQAGRPTTQGHTGATAVALGVAPHTKANKVGLDRQVAQYGGGGGPVMRGIAWRGQAGSVGRAAVAPAIWLPCGMRTGRGRRGHTGSGIPPASRLFRSQMSRCCLGLKMMAPVWKVLTTPRPRQPAAWPLVQGLQAQPCARAAPRDRSRCRCLYGTDPHRLRTRVRWFHLTGCRWPPALMTQERH